MWCCGSPSGRRIFVSLSDKAILLKNVSHEFDVIFWIRLKRYIYHMPIFWRCFESLFGCRIFGTMFAILLFPTWQACFTLHRRDLGCFFLIYNFDPIQTITMPTVTHTHPAPYPRHLEAYDNHTDMYQGVATCMHSIQIWETTMLLLAAPTYHVTWTHLHPTIRTMMSLILVRRYPYIESGPFVSLYEEDSGNILCGKFRGPKIGCGNC